MGVNAAIFRSPVRGSSHNHIRTEANDQNWLNGEKLRLHYVDDHLTRTNSYMPPPLSHSEPDFVGSFSIPDTHSPDDDKIYLFFRERAAEAGQWDQRVYSRVARVCKVHTESICMKTAFLIFTE